MLSIPHPPLNSLPLGLMFNAGIDPILSTTQDIHDLGLKFDRLTYTSDYFPQLFEIGEKLIKTGVLYCDDTPVDQMRDVSAGSKQTFHPLSALDANRVWFCNALTSSVVCRSGSSSSSRSAAPAA